MSEEILKALMQLFAIVAKQDEGVESTQVEYVKNFLQQQLNDEDVKEYFMLFRQYSGMEQADGGVEVEEERSLRRLTSVKDSVRILGLCKKINKTLTQKQKVVALVRLFEIVNADRKFTDQRMQIINTVAEVFKVEKEEFTSIESFVVKNEVLELDDINILIINDRNENLRSAKKIPTKHLQGNIFILKINSVDLYFLKYTGTEDLFLNGLPIRNDRIYLFANGSTVKLPKSAPVYYSDVVAHFMADSLTHQISCVARDITFRFPNGNVGIKDISFAETHGRLIGIMGASGAGKTTLLNILCGIEAPTEGEVMINGIDLHRNREKLEGVIGLVPQDDLLIEELTVYENLYYNAKLCFKDITEEEIDSLVVKTLQNLGLYDRKDLKVGSPLKKMISGGQRKRLNIALELIREPAILFVDEPTSGLSSRDSENVMDLLRELALKGKLIFVVIHQPSSEIYKMFDRMIILDTGGYLIYYGNPVEAVMYFKRLDAQINSEVGECQTCGNVNPELIFNIIEAKVVDEFGNYTDSRKVTPQQWEDHFKQSSNPIENKPSEEHPLPKNLKIPGWFSQFRIYTIRDFLSKVSNRQYVALSLLEAPLLGFILSSIIRYIEDPDSGKYIFRVNENVPIFIFMALIVALFLGLTISAEEIFRDRKILKRESFLNLSRSSYLFSKIAILFTISAIQSLLFIIVANNFLGIRDMGFSYWFALFSTAAFANMLGLNISASFNSAVTIYILIPLVMIPMMILSGAMFSFDKLNRRISRVDKVPVMAEFMVTKWGYEALMVHQYKDNKFMKNKLYYIEKDESQSDFKKVYWLPELYERLERIEKELDNIGSVSITASDLLVVANEVVKESLSNSNIAPFENPEELVPGKFNAQTLENVNLYLASLDKYYGDKFQRITRQKENYFNYYLDRDPDAYNLLRDRYHNEGVADIVRKVYEKNKILEFNHELIQHYDPIYQDPFIGGPFTLRTHFYAPEKPFLGKTFDTYWYNMIVIWLLTLLLYIALYFEWLKKLIDRSQRSNMKKS
jgi:ABC-type multidrug transport system ATPase subunit